MESVNSLSSNSVSWLRRGAVSEGRGHQRAWSDRRRERRGAWSPMGT